MSVQALGELVSPIPFIFDLIISIDVAFTFAEFDWCICGTLGEILQNSFIFFSQRYCSGHVTGLWKDSLNQTVDYRSVDVSFHFVIFIHAGSGAVPSPIREDSMDAMTSLNKMIMK